MAAALSPPSTADEADAMPGRWSLRPPSPRTWRRFYVVAALTIGFATLIIRPNLSGTDEFSHFTRIVTLGHGLVVPATDDTMALPYRMDACERMAVISAFTTYHDSGADQRPGFGEQFDAVPCDAAHSIPTSSADSRAPNADVNPPTVYLPTAIGYRLGSAFGGVTWGILTARLLQLVAAVVLTWLALRIVPRGHGLFVTVALVPAVVQIDAQLSADPLSNAAAFIWIALVLRTIDEVAGTGDPPTRRRVVELAAAGIGLAVTKPFLAPLLLAALAIPWARTRAKDQIARLTALVAPAAVLVAGWYLLVVSRIDIVVPIRGADSAAASHAITRHPVSFLAAVGRGLSDPAELRRALNEVVELLLHDGPAVTAAWATVMGIACVIAVVAAWWGGRGTGRFTLPFDPVRVAVIAALVVVEIVIIEYGVAISYNAPMTREITGLQGRYLVPLVPLAYVATRPRRDLGTRAQGVLSAAAIVLVVIANIWSLGSAYATFYA